MTKRVKNIYDQVPSPKAVVCVRGLRFDFGSVRGAYSIEAE